MNPAQNPDALAGTLCVIVGGVLAVVLVIAIFFLLTLQKALSRVSPRNRLMEPGMVWLMLIPCFNIIWQFFIVIRVPGSLRNEFRDRNRDDGSDYGKGIGLAYAVLNLVGSCAGNSQRGQPPEFAMTASGISLVLSIIGLILFIAFWVKIASYSKQLAEDDSGPRDWERKFDDDDDDGFGRRGPGAGSPGLPPDAIKEGDAGHYQ